jgi:hypothetical protein
MVDNNKHAQKRSTFTMKIKSIYLPAKGKYMHTLSVSKYVFSICLVYRAAVMWSNKILFRYFWSYLQSVQLRRHLKLAVLRWFLVPLDVAKALVKAI